MLTCCSGCALITTHRHTQIHGHTHTSTQAHKHLWLACLLAFLVDTKPSPIIGIAFKALLYISKRTHSFFVVVVCVCFFLCCAFLFFITYKHRRFFFFTLIFLSRRLYREADVFAFFVFIPTGFFFSALYYFLVCVRVLLVHLCGLSSLLLSWTVPFSFSVYLFSFFPWRETSFPPPPPIWHLYLYTRSRNKNSNNNNT